MRAEIIMVIHRLMERTPKLYFNYLIRRKHTRKIILHHTAGGDVAIETIHRWHWGKGGVGYHFLVRASGEIERGRPLEMQGAHARGANADSIGIALTGNFEYARPNSKQLQALDRLIRYLYSIYKRLPIIGHLDVSRTFCPGKFFDLEEVRKELERVKLVINGRESDNFVCLVEGRSFVSLRGAEGPQWVLIRSIANLLGAMVTFNEENRVVTLEIPK